MTKEELIARFWEEADKPEETKEKGDGNIEENQARKQGQVILNNSIHNYRNINFDARV